MHSDNGNTAKTSKQGEPLARIPITTAPQEYFEMPIETGDHKPRTWLLGACRAVVVPFTKFVYRLQVRGFENVPQGVDGPVLFVANHVSYFDPVALWVAAQPLNTRFLARANLWRIPVFKGMLSRVGAIPVEPESADTKAIKRAAKALKRNETMCIFAEGTRMRTPDKVYKPHAGFALIANMGKAKIVPVGITGTERIRPYNKPFLRFPKLTVTFGQPIEVATYKELPKEDRTDALVRDTMTQVFALRDSADPKPIRPGLPPYGIVGDMPGKEAR